MTTPRRFAALAVCLLALAAGAAAANECNSVKGSFSMELISVSGNGANTAQLATCLSNVQVNLDANCNVFLNSTAAGGAFIDAMWSTEATLTYKQLQECPSSSAAPIDTSSSPPAAASDLNTPLKTLLSKFAYGGKRDFTLNSVAIAGGLVTVTDTATPDMTWVYAIKESTTSLVSLPTNATLLAASLTIGTHYQTDAASNNMGDACPTGTYGYAIEDNQIRLCLLCPVGTTGDGTGCTGCAAGYASGKVGASVCNLDTADATNNICPAGYYAQQGSSACLPCPAGTYSDAKGATECTRCPEDSWSWIPGSSNCLRCVNGKPTCAAGVCTGFPTSAAGDSSPGNHIVSVTKMDATACPARATTKVDYRIPIYETCTSWATAATTPTLQLSVYVSADCAVTIRPIGDPLCADAGATEGEVPLKPLPATPYSYSYNDLVIHAYYATPTSIRTLLPSNSTAGSSSFMLGLDATTGTALTLNFWAATNKPDGVLTGVTTCTSTVNVAGGQVALLPTTAAACPAGSYSVANEYCYPCPQGYYCAGNTALRKACPAGSFNQLLGMDAQGDCTDCSPTTQADPKFTSFLGAAYCTAPYFERNCTAAGKYFDESESACVDCPAGTFRPANDASLECQPCPAGTYSAAGAGSCIDCPAGQYNPSTGLADQSSVTPGVNCLRCPGGSIALANGETMPEFDDSFDTATADYRNEKPLSAKAIACAACPSGTYADPTKTEASSNAKGCSLCGINTYRSGDAAPENNKCLPIPDGYKAKALIATASSTGVYEVDKCEIGKYSNWKTGSRVPTNSPTTCESCALNAYAPRTGMTACIECKGGWYPNAGKSACVQCAAGDYRSFYDKRVDCINCNTAGYESGPSGRTACTQCRPGTFKGTFNAGWTALEKDNCQPCEQHTYMARPGATVCVVCPKGTDTQDEGNTECTPCSVGYYKKVAGKTACGAAEAGTFVNTTGAYFTTPCPLGTWNDKTGQDSCDPCPPGQYANALGSKSCKTCPAGTYSVGQSSTCKACQAGYYSPAGSGACSPCKPGTYTNAARSGTCTLCPKGSQCPTPATSSPKACPAGTYASKDGSVRCAPCPVNFISTAVGSKQCTACAAGTNTRGLTGQTKCQTVRVTTLRRSVL